MKKIILLSILIWICPALHAQEKRAILVNGECSTPVDINGNPVAGFNIYYYGVGSGINVNIQGMGRTALVQ